MKIKNPKMNQILQEIKNSKNVLGSDFLKKLFDDNKNLNECQLYKISNAISKKNKELEQQSALRAS